MFNRPPPFLLPTEKVTASGSRNISTLPATVQTIMASRNDGIAMESSSLPLWLKVGATAPRHILSIRREEQYI
jgi:hypothetical protein